MDKSCPLYFGPGLLKAGSYAEPQDFVAEGVVFKRSPGVWRELPDGLSGKIGLVERFAFGDDNFE